MEKPAVFNTPNLSPLRLAAALALAAGLARPVLAQSNLDPQEAARQAEKLRQLKEDEYVNSLPPDKREVYLKEKNAAAAAAASSSKTQIPAAGQAPITSSGRGRATAPGANPNGAQPGANPSGAARPPSGLRVEGADHGGASGASGIREVGPDEVTLSAMSDAVELKTLVEYVAETLQINIAGNDALTGSVVLNAPVTVKKADLLKLLNSLLEQQNFMITKDDTGWYKVIDTPSLVLSPDPLSTTRVIPTPTVRPSSLSQAINEQLGVQNGKARLSYMDELGVIVATDSPRHLDALASFIASILERNSGLTYKRFDLAHIAPNVARQRLLDLMGQSNPSPTGAVIINAGQGQPGVTGQPTNSITNVADRLTADPASSALYFRGYPDEFAQVADLLKLIDRPNELHYQQYFAGSGAQQIAQLAERLGLGHVEIVDGSNQPATTQPGVQQFGVQQPAQRGNVPQIQNQLGQQQSSYIGGPVMIVDSVRSTIIYYGTNSQHEQLEDLIKKFDTDREQVVIATYKVKNKPADVVADILNGIAFNQNTGGSTNDFLPGGNGFFGFGNFNNRNNQNGFQNNTNGRTNSSRSSSSSGSSRSTRTNAGNTRTQNNNTPFNNPAFRFNQPGSAQTAVSNDLNDPLGGPEVFILPDTANQQILVKAPARQQEEFAKVIAKLDQRSPQVCIEVQIVAVTATDDFRLAFEEQLIAGQFKLNTNFGLGTLSQTTTGTGGATNTTGNFSSQKQVNTNLSGFTSALIKSNYVPLVMTALKQNTDTRIVASPYILVDDNVEAEIVSLDEQPTSTTTQGTATTNTTFGGYEEAGTRLTVTPSISEGGYLRLMYEIELSNFVGTGTNGFPPPKQTRNVRSDSVTIPGDTTIVVGGIKSDSTGSTIAKIPLLGNIPLLGYLFRDTNTNNSNTRLYVFITPRIFRDANFRDPILYTMGPRAEAGIAPDYPELKPAMIEMIGPGTKPAEPSAEPYKKPETKKPENHRLWPDPHAD